MKKFITLFICAMLVCAFAVTSLALSGENYAVFSDTSDVTLPVNEHIGGDANGDGEVTLIDVIAILRYTVGDEYNTSYHGVDATEDGEINVLDAIAVIRHILGTDVGLGTLVEAK